MELDDDRAKRIPERLIGMDDTSWHRERLKLRLLGVAMSAFAAWLFWEGGGPWPVAVVVGLIEH